MKPTISVVICTHNPRQEYLQRVLQALQNQTLSKQQWELLLIDNASNTLLAHEIDLQWHPLARHVREKQLGLTHARLRGIEESIGEILIFVDDDNILEPDYLENSFKVSKDWSILGAWGGQLIPEFEQTPPEWAKPYLPFLALREFDRDTWSNANDMNASVPVGAGLCVRKTVAQRYADIVKNDNKRTILGRKGNLMTCFEDIDLALTSCELNLGTGTFKSLKLTHIIPANRIQEKYLLKLIKGIYYSQTLMNVLRGKQAPDKLSFRMRILQSYIRWRMNPMKRRFHDAKQEGIDLAIREIASW